MTRRPKPAAAKQRLTRQTRLRLNRVYAGAGDFSRNLGLLFVAAPLVDPLINPSHAISAGRIALSMLVGLVLVGSPLYWLGCRRIEAMDSPQWWLAAAFVVIPVIILDLALIAYGAWLDRKIEEEERHMPPAE